MESRTGEYFYLTFLLSALMFNYIKIIFLLLLKMASFIYLQPNFPKGWQKSSKSDKVGLYGSAPEAV